MFLLFSQSRKDPISIFTISAFKEYYRSDFAIAAAVELTLPFGNKFILFQTIYQYTGNIHTLRISRICFCSSPSRERTLERGLEYLSAFLQDKKKPSSGTQIKLICLSLIIEFRKTCPFHLFVSFWDLLKCVSLTFLVKFHESRNR